MAFSHLQHITQVMPVMGVRNRYFRDDNIHQRAVMNSGFPHSCLPTDVITVTVAQPAALQPRLKRSTCTHTSFCWETEVACLCFFPAAARLMGQNLIPFHYPPSLKTLIVFLHFCVDAERLGPLSGSLQFILNVE